MNHGILSLLVIALSLAVSGCSSFSGKIAFRNESTKEVWVDKADGFEYQAACGVLIPGSYKGSSWGRMKYPEKIILHWSYGYDKSDLHTAIPLLSSPPPTQEAEIQFVFTREERWTVEWKNQ